MVGLRLVECVIYIVFGEVCICDGYITFERHAWNFSAMGMKLDGWLGYVLSLCVEHFVLHFFVPHFFPVMGFVKV